MTQPAELTDVQAAALANLQEKVADAALAFKVCEDVGLGQAVLMPTLVQTFKDAGLLPDDWKVPFGLGRLIGAG